MKAKCIEDQGKGHPLSRGLNVLLVDDDDICIFIHRRVLEQSGVCRWTESAADGRTALELVDAACAGDLPFPDIIFLDLQMPVMDGLGFLQAFRQLDPQHRERIAIVLLSSSVSEKDRSDAESLGVRHCLSKPFTSEALQRVLASLYTSNSPAPASA